MTKVRMLLLCPAGSDEAALDQAVGARAAAVHGPAAPAIELVEETFHRGDLGDLAKKAALWAGKVAGVVSATNVAESSVLGEVAEKLAVLCFVANNNPAVWQGRSHVFHLGLPTEQTAKAVAHRLKETGFERIFLVHDVSEFQRRVADAMKSQLEKRDMRVASRLGSRKSWLGAAAAWKPDLLYVVYSDENKALPLALDFRKTRPETPLLFGRSLLRQSFIEALGPAANGALFVDLFRRGKNRGAAEGAFMAALALQGIMVPTANHGFGWDMMSLCGQVLNEACGNVSSAVAHFESGVALTGATGRFRFHKDNHNGREEFCPTCISRCYRGQLEEVTYG
jgi:ABC-type branched-subunit amino acid transport system substrate-binding protein